LENTCRELLDRCLTGLVWSADLLDRALAVDDGREFLSVVVERLADLFEPRLCDIYVDLFTDVIEVAAPQLVPRTRRLTTFPPSPESTDRVYFLSRVTLGADVAITSVLMDAAKKRYPDAEVLFVGPQKNYELFAADARVKHFPAPYSRGGSLKDRLAATAALWIENGIVIDPDSRLTQLGMITVCPAENYHFFNSRASGKDGNDRLPDLAAQWAKGVFGVENAKPYVAPSPVSGPAAEITVSLGVGENTAKRVDDQFETELLRLLGESGESVLVDLGGSDEERARVTKALQPGMRTHDGAFAPFAAEIVRSKLFVGYDSAAGHVASASGVPVISIARGFANERMAARWRPLGDVVKGNDPDILSQIKALLSKHRPSA
jgi:hypothetical protein